ncbi:hypothetical protein [Phenylobacterium sp.]|uniref:hypothetical protein n=1 Tax=Phenylobacterium sp. TaxID=1871053 RepID=UPI002869EF1C|nr:hypothetical protein [Phenylobacterium sp.]
MLAGLAGGGVLAARGESAIRAMQWMAPGADPARVLGSSPTECLRRPADPLVAHRVEVGRAAFRTPLVLGGQAGRAGISCETCHRAGRSNPDFLFPGISGAPGTADVTSSLFSTHRDNGIDDPKPIPDLSGPKSALKVSQARGDRKLEPFLDGLITQEFDGPEPSPAVLDGLAAYVRALDPAACPAAPRQPLGVSMLMDDVRRALRAGQAEIARGDPATARVMIAAARTRLGLIDERFDTPALAASRRALRAADRELADAQAGLRAGRPDVSASLAAWLRRSRPLEARLVGQSPRSLFDPARLAQAAKRRLPG